MNVLTMVSAFIILFAIGFYTFFHSFCNQIQQHGHFIGAMENTRHFFNSSQKQKYRNLPGENLHPNKKCLAEKKTNSSTTFKSPRESFNPNNECKLNIFAFSTKQIDPKLEKISRELIKYLYELTPFYYEGFENDFIETLIETFQEFPSITCIEELIDKFSEDKSRLYYKLFKGTQNYKLRVSGEGYPPLSDFLSIDSESKRPIHFSYASTPLLKIVFNDAIANKIFLDEKKYWEKDHKHKPLTKVELEKLLLEERKNPADYDNLLYFTTSKKAKPCKLLKDEKTGVQIKVKK